LLSIFATSVVHRKEKLASLRETKKREGSAENTSSESSSPIVDKNASRAAELLSSK
jgi:hypothetical protein